MLDVLIRRGGFGEMEYVKWWMEEGSDWLGLWVKEWRVGNCYEFDVLGGILE